MATHVMEHETHSAPYTGMRPLSATALDVLSVMMGRIIFGGFFLFSSLDHFIARGALVSATAAAGVPFPELAVIGSGILLAAGGFGLMTGLWPKIGSAMIIVFLLGVTPVMHAFWNDPAGPQRIANLINFGKNVALLGGALIAAGTCVDAGRRVLAIDRQGD